MKSSANKCAPAGRSLWGGVSSTHRLQRVASAGGAAEKVPPPVDATSGFGGLRTWPTTRHGSSTTRMTQLDIGQIEIPQRSSPLSYFGVLSFRSEAREASGSETARVHHAARRGGCRIAISATPNIATWRRSRMRCGDFKNIAARRTAMAARRQETAIVRVLTQTVVAAANDIALCANS
jgi:hypothetical protein